MRLSLTTKLKIVTLFALAGPPIGAVISVAASAKGPRSGQGAVENAVGYAVVLAFAIPYSWIFGLVPAIVTGITSAASWSVLRESLVAHRATRALLGAAWGYVATFGFKWLAFGLENPPGPLPLEVIGALSGLLCAASVPALWVRPNNSSKPTPLRGAA